MTTRDTRDEQLSDEERLRCPICAGQRIGGRPNDGPILYVTPHAPNECRDVLRERAEKAERALAELAKIHHETRKPSALHADATAFGACEALSCISARNVLRLAHVKEENRES